MRPLGSTFRAVPRDKSIGRPVALGVHLDRFDQGVELIGPADLDRHTVDLAGQEHVGFANIIQRIRALGVAVEQLELRTSLIPIPRKKEQMIGAGVERGGMKGTGWVSPLPHGQRRRGVHPSDSASVGLSRRAVPQKVRPSIRRRGGGPF